MDPSHHQPTVDSGDDEQDGMSIQEFVRLEIPPETFPVTNRLQKMLAKMLRDDQAEDGEDHLIDALATMVVNLETALVNTTAAVVNAHSLSTNLVAYAIGLETRIIKAGVRIQSAQAEVDALISATREDPI
jgi:hypothetical protein